MKTWLMLSALTVLGLTAAPARAEETRELLSLHDTVAVFEGISLHRCLGRTALCPDRCGDSGNLAKFRILGYLDYQKPGEYGDKQQGAFSFLVDDTLKQLHIPAAFADIVRALKPGDRVRLVWRHDYVTRKDGGTEMKFPDRPLQTIEPLTPEQAEALLNPKPVAPAPQSPAASAAPPVLTLTAEVPAALDSFDGAAHAILYAYDPLLADRAADAIADVTFPVRHTKGDSTPIRIEMTDVKPREGRFKHYVVLEVFADPGRTHRVMAMGDFCKVFESGAPDTVAVPITPVAQ